MISITDAESSIFKILLAAASGTDSTVRVVGGWVRDKLMGLDSDDIDISVDNLTGLEFAINIAQHQGLGDKVGVIKANPDKSKHLSSAVMFINGQEVQFTGFRKETYVAASRVPRVEAGSIAEDTYRRDFTVNSLYYNLNTDAVEDISTHGLSDINKRTLRLMVPPQELWGDMNISSLAEAECRSFTEDPLRVLRAIRFACRFNFGLSKSLVKAAVLPEVIASFGSKISRDRIQIEFSKMMTGASPARAVSLIKDMGYLDMVLKKPEGYVDWDWDQDTPYHSLTVWDHTTTALDKLQLLFKSMSVPAEDRMVMNLAMLIHDVGKLDPTIHGTKAGAKGKRTTYYGHEARSIEAAGEMLKGLPGTTKKDIARVQLLIDGSSRANPNYTDLSQECELSNKALSKFIKKMGDDWQNAIILNMADSTSKHADDTQTCYYHMNMISRIRSLGPAKVMNMRPLLSGDEIIDMFGKKPGPWVGRIITKLLEWQYQTPDAERDGAVKKLKEFGV